MQTSSVKWYTESMANNMKRGKGGAVDEFQLVDAVLSQHDTSDMTADEVYDLLLDGGVSPGYAQGIAQDLCPVG